MVRKRLAAVLLLILTAPLKTVVPPLAVVQVEFMLGPTALEKVSVFVAELEIPIEPTVRAEPPIV